MEKRRKILLVVGNTAWDCKRAFTEPTSAVPILTTLLKEEFDLHVIDANGRNMSEEETLDEIKESHAELVLITALSVEWHTCYHKVADLAKKALGCKTMMGGVYPTVSGDYVLEDDNIDWIMLGYAEGRINNICRMILDNDMRLEKEPGIGYKRDGRIIINPMSTYIGDVKEMVKPDYSYVDLNLYISEEKSDNALVKREASIITSYGCPYNCVFCATRTISGRKVAFRPVKDILEEIEYLIENYNIDSIRFLDDNILADKERAKTLFHEMLNRNYNIKFQLMNTAAWLLDEEILDLMKSAGCYALTISIESGNSRVLKEIMHKPLNKEIVPPVIQLCKERDIYVSANIVIGLPGETWNEILETLRFAEICNPDFLQINIATVFPKTDLYNIAKEQKCLPPDFSFYDDEAYYGFALGHITTEEFTPQELMIIRSFEWDRINFTDPIKRKKFCKFKGMSEKKLSQIRKESRRNIGLTYLSHRKDLKN